MPRAYNDGVRQRVTSAILARGEARPQVWSEVVAEIPHSASGELRPTVSDVVRRTSAATDPVRPAGGHEQEPADDQSGYPVPGGIPRDGGAEET